MNPLAGISRYIQRTIEYRRPIQDQSTIDTEILALREALEVLIEATPKMLKAHDLQKAWDDTIANQIDKGWVQVRPPCDLFIGFGQDSPALAPEPWTYERTEHPDPDLAGHFGFVIKAAGGGTVAEIFTRSYAGVYVSEDSARLLAATRSLLAGCEAALHFIENAPFDLKNGVEHMGIDEGEVLGWRFLNELAEQIRAAIFKATGKSHCRICDKPTIPDELSGGVCQDCFLKADQG